MRVEYAGAMDATPSAWGYAQRVLIAWLLVVPTLLAASVKLFPPTVAKLSGGVEVGVGAGVLAQGIAAGLDAFGVGVLSLLMIACAGCAMLLHGLAGGRVRWFSTACVALGVATALWHLSGSSEDGFFGSMWIAGALVGLAALHVTQDATVRRWVAAMLLGMLGVWLLSALWYLHWEHPMTVAMFEHHAGDMLQAQGIEPGTSAEALYRRRLGDRVFIGSAGLSNVTGGMVAMVTMIVSAFVASVFFYCLRNKQKPFTADTAMSVVLLLVGGYVVWLTQSRGAMVAMVFVGLWVVAAAWWRERAWAGRWDAALKHGLVFAGAAVVLLAIGAVVVRSVFFGVPDSAAGERSLLFRWWYWVGAWQVAWDAGIGVLAGVGAFGFGDVFPRVKPPLLTEDVTSTHNVWIDWLVMLGAGGAGWLVASAWWLIDGLNRCVTAGDEPGPIESPWGMKVQVYAVAGVALLIFGSQFFIEQAEMYLEAVGVWLLCVISFIVIVLWMVRSRGGIGVAIDRGLGLGVVAAGLLVMVHGQIAMTFFQPASVAFVWLGLGMCGAKPQHSAETESSGSLRVGGAASRVGSGDASGVGVGLAMLVVMLLVGGLWVSQAKEATATQTVASQLRQRVWLVPASQVDLADVDQLLELRPHALKDHIRAGMLYEQRGERERAVAAYQRALQISEAMYLDPVHMLEPAQREHLETRLRMLAPR